MSAKNGGAHGALILSDNGTAHAFRMLTAVGPGRYVAGCGKVVAGLGVESGGKLWPYALSLPRCGACARTRPNAWVSS